MSTKLADLTRPHLSWAIYLTALVAMAGCSPMSSAPVALPDDPWFQKQVDGETPVLVVFGASWCGPCRQMEPELEKLEEMYSGKLRVVHVDVDERSNISDYYSVSSVPRLMVFSHGHIVDDEVGGRPLYALRELVSPHIE